MTVDQLRENVAVAFQSLRSRKGRSALTLLGIVIGVAAVIAVAAIIEGLNRDVVGRVQQLGSKVFFISRIPQGSIPGRLPEKIRVRRYLEPEYADAIEERAPSVEHAAVFADRSVVYGHSNEIRYGNRSVERFFLRGVGPDFDEAVPLFSVVEGRFFNESDANRARYVAVLGQNIAAELFGPLDPIGRVVRLNGLPFEVIGLFAEDEGLFGGPGVNQFVSIPYATFHKLYPEIREHYLAISVADTALLPRAVDETVAVLRLERRTPPQAENDFEILLPEFLENLWSQLTGTLFLLTFAVSSIALVVGGIGVMNVMLISVTERTREIGVRKAVGARRQDIRAQFLIEALALTFAGGLIGIVAGGAASWTVSIFFPTFTAYLSPEWIVAGVLVSAATGLFFGYYPATRAALLDPIVALRYE